MEKEINKEDFEKLLSFIMVVAMSTPTDSAFLANKAATIVKSLEYFKENNRNEQ